MHTVPFKIPKGLTYLHSDDLNWRRDHVGKGGGYSWEVTQGCSPSQTTCLQSCHETCGVLHTSRWQHRWTCLPDNVRLFPPKWSDKNTVCSAKVERVLDVDKSLCLQLDWALPAASVLDGDQVTDVCVSQDLLETGWFTVDLFSLYSQTVSIHSDLKTPK